MSIRSRIARASRTGLRPGIRSGTRPAAPLALAAAALLGTVLGACGDATGPARDDQQPRSPAVNAVSLAPAQVEHFATADSLELRFAAARDSGQYAIVAYYAADSATFRASFTATATGVAVPPLSDLGAVATAGDVPAAARLAGPVAARLATPSTTPSAQPLSGPSALAGDDPVVSDAALHRRLRAIGRLELGPDRLARAREEARALRAPGGAFARRALIVAGGPAVTLDGAAPGGGAGTVNGIGMPIPAVAQVAPRVGDRMRLNAAAGSACDTTTSGFRVGRVAAVTQRAIVVADTLNPAGGFTDAEYASIGAAFDTLAWPVDVQAFGEPSDIDRNGRVLIFFTSAVNALTPPNAGFVVGGFFWERDLFPNSVRTRDNCAGSNASEMFYMLVPDPFGRVNGNVRSKRYVSETTVGVLAHEFQHLINGARRLYTTDAEDFEEVWLNEGLSHVAEELTFYRAAGLAPRARLTGPGLQASARVAEAFNTFGTDNFRRLLRYLQDTESQSPFADDDELPTRGATWQFLRYAADRQAAQGVDETTFWRRLVDGRAVGRRNLQDALRVSGSAGLDDWFRDWAVTNVADAQTPAIAGLSATYAFPSWNLRSVLGGYRDQAALGYALRPRALLPELPQAVSLDGGAVSYMRLATAPGREASVRVRTDLRRGALRVAVVRIR